jgi:hypothetical protein
MRPSSILLRQLGRDDMNKYTIKMWDGKTVTLEAAGATPFGGCTLRLVGDEGENLLLVADGAWITCVKDGFPLLVSPASERTGKRR